MNGDSIGVPRLWGTDFFFDWPAYSQSWIIRFIQNRHVKKSPHIQGHGWDYRKSGAYRVTVSVGVWDIHPKGTSLLNASLCFNLVQECWRKVLFMRLTI